MMTTMAEPTEVDAAKMQAVSEKLLEALGAAEDDHRIMAAALGVTVGAIALASGKAPVVLATVNDMAQAMVNGELFS
jgi:hypothetical protein